MCPIPSTGRNVPDDPSWKVTAKRPLLTVSSDKRLVTISHATVRNPTSTGTKPFTLPEPGASPPPPPANAPQLGGPYPTGPLRLHRRRAYGHRSSAAHPLL